MDKVERERLGKVAHQALVRYFAEKNMLLPTADNTWEGLDEDTKELYRCEAEAVVAAQ